MKFSSLAVIPGVVSSQDDTSTLLSMNLRVQSTLESGVDQLLESVGSRNVTQMSSFLQNLVAEVITEDAGDSDINLDGDVQEALDMIKQVLLGQIRGALKEAHCQDQKDLHNQIMCFKGCEDNKISGGISCGDACDGSVHASCREDLLDSYVEHITACRTLDQFVHEFSSEKCPPEKKAGCHLPHTTWNCKACAGQINVWSNSLSTSLGTWINDQIGVFKNAYTTWEQLHNSCKQSYHNYISKDAECDCKQAECETRNCEWEKCHVVNCETTYNSCWMHCEKQHEETEKAKECLEKDRKIDWSATEKIECYVNVLLEKPDNATLLATCGTDSCYNEYRKEMYHKCNDICVEVDFEGSWDEHDRRATEEGTYSGRQTDVKDQSSHRHGDIDVTEEGDHSVRTRHRAAHESDEHRCTSHLDLDYQLPPCCQPCEPRPSPPCVGQRADGDYTGGLDSASYMWRYYGKHGFLSKDAVSQLDGSLLSDLALARCSLHAGTVGLSDCGETLEAKKCETGEHTKEYAYNLCDCVSCSVPASPTQTCTAAKTCTAAYDYSKHHITGDCSAKTNPPVCGGTTTPGATEWKAYGTNFLYVDVDTSKCGFTETPHYVSAMQGTTSHWTSKGSSEIYSPTATGFRIYLYLEVSPATANQRKYAIHWFGASADTKTDDICTGQSANWVAYGTDDMVQDVDTSSCGFTDRPIYVTSMQGKSSHWTSTGSSEVYSADKDSFRQYIDGSAPAQALNPSYDYKTNYLAVSPTAASPEGCAGRTSPSDWIRYGSEGIYVDVDMSKCGFTSTPVIVSSLHGKSSHWVSTGSSEIYFNAGPPEKKFRVYIHTTAAIVSNNYYSNDYAWSLEWFAVQV